ncbi:MAG: Asp-tRNA(Asn)/Glu-tRNA(Gln) amidotransferase subunit GatC [Planctomycetota bacterium]
MTDGIDRRQVRAVAKLARLELDESEVTEFTGQLQTIIEYVEKMQRVNTEGVEPLAHCLPITNRFRHDEVKDSLAPDEALENAPARDGDYFKVPRMLDETPGA